MKKRIKQRVTVNGTEHWVTGETQQDVFDAYLRLCVKEGIIPETKTEKFPRKESPLFKDYARSYLNTFKTNQEALTVVNRERLFKNHILPKFGDLRLDSITITLVQEWFNDLGMNYSRETILKLKHIAAPIMEAALEDRLIELNPFKSSRLEIHGRSTVSHRAIPKFKMEALRSGLLTLKGRERMMAALLSTTGMRFEEILGLRWEDIDQTMILFISFELWYIRLAINLLSRNQNKIKLSYHSNSIKSHSLSFTFERKRIYIKQRRSS